MLVDNLGKILMANASMESLSGYCAGTLDGQNIDIFLPSDLRTKRTQSMCDYFALRKSRSMGSVDLQLLRRDGKIIPVDVSVGHTENDVIQHSVVFVRDMTARKTLEATLKHQATHDELTGLSNRWLFRLQLNKAVVKADRSKCHMAILFLDLDFFKNVNDTYGHATGDALLVQVAARMRSVVRESDTLARMGGDEFAILLTDLPNVDEAVHVAAKLLVALQPAYRLKDQVLHSGASLGVAFYPDDSQDCDTLLRYADLAMYQAKQAGRGTYACYSYEMDHKVRESMQLHTRLKEAIEQNLLELHYQPQVGVESGLIVGVEALLRWDDPVLGPVSPARFIPVAEATGLILTLSAWVLREACRQIATWSTNGTPVRVAINVSAQQFRQPDLPEQVRSALALAGAHAEWLDIEITESAAMAQPELAREHIDALVRMGCRVALDDFGTGYSSLGYLKVLPVSKLKIDKIFMDGIPNDAGNVTLSRAIISLAHSMGMTLVAEGVETPAQLQFLYQNNCEIYQGWLYSKAINASAMTTLLNADPPESEEL